MAEARFRSVKDVNEITAFPGVTRRTMASGDLTTLMRIEVAAGQVVPEHSHPHEQTGTVVSGVVSVRLGGASTRTICVAGDAYIIPGGLLHEFTAVEDAVLIECFSPVREDYAND